MRKIDFRSDTVTKPSPGMLEAIATAELGDDVYGEDPSVNELEIKAARITGKEASLFVASGTMANLIAILAHADRGGEIIVGNKSHIFVSEAGGASALGGVSYHVVPNNSKGLFDIVDLEAAFRDDTNYHHPITSLLAFENTHNNCGGIAISPEDLNPIIDWAQEYNLPTHVDGARIFNASTRLDIPVQKLVERIDSVSFCLSKGLACPVGSMICGDEKFINKARRIRKMLGGGMRQAGILASAGIFALDNMLDRLLEDHINAAKLAQGLSDLEYIDINHKLVETNLVFFNVSNEHKEKLHLFLESHGIKGGSATGNRWRFTTHYGISSEDIDYTIEVMKEYSNVECAQSA